MDLWELLMIHQLNHIIEKNFKNFLDLKSFEKIDEMNSSLGALIIFKNSEFKIQFVIDKGILDIQITTAENSKYYEVSVLEEICKNSEKFSLKGYEDVLDFLEKKYLWIFDFFKIKNFDSIYSEKLNQRTRKLFPNL